MGWGFSDVIGAVMNPIDSVFQLKASITGESDRWVPSNSGTEPPMAQENYPNRRHQNSNIIPAGPSSINDGERPAYIACRVVGGGALDGALGQAWRSNMLSYSTAPNPDHHWCVVVGDHLHQLQATNLFDGDNYYTNEKFNLYQGGWRTFQISSTSYNDIAIRNAAVEVMNGMPETYNVLNNNCQTFTLRLLDRIIKNGRRVQQQVNGSYGLMRAPKMELKAEPLILTRINEDGTETDEVVGYKSVVVEEEEAKKQPEVEVAEIKVGDDDDEDVSGLNAETREKILPLVDAFKIMYQETPVIEFEKEA